ncbi:MAG: DedA family protein [Candidatus Taylorbacteria bacterium]
MDTWLLHFSTDHSVLIYFAIIVLACAEGPILSIFFGALIKIGAFPFLPVYAALMAGDLIGDIVWYEIGRHGASRFVYRFGKYFNLTPERIEKATKIFHKYHGKILIVSKVTNGFGLALVTLMVAGMVRIPFVKYLLINLVGQFFWTGILLASGYFLGDMYMKFDSIFGKVSVVVIFVIILLALNEYRKYIGSQIGKDIA